MKTRVKTGNLRDIRQPRGNRIDRRQIVRLMERCQRAKLLQFTNNVPVDLHRRRKERPAMNYPMADPCYRRSGQGLPSHFKDRSHGLELAKPFGGPAAFGEVGPIPIAGRQARRNADLLDLAAQQQWLVALAVIKSEFDARRAGIHYRDAFGHVEFPLSSS